MFSGFFTFLVLSAVPVVKYGTVNRIAWFNQRLREAEARIRHNEELLRLRRRERLNAEREEGALIQKRHHLEATVQQLGEELALVKGDNLDLMVEIGVDTVEGESGIKEETAPVVQEVETLA